MDEYGAALCALLLRPQREAPRPGTKRAQPGWFMAAHSGPEHLKWNKCNYSVSHGRFCGFCRNTSALLSLFLNEFCSFLQTSCRNVINLLQGWLIAQAEAVSRLSCFFIRLEAHICLLCIVIIKRTFLPPLAELFCFSHVIPARAWLSNTPNKGSIWKLIQIFSTMPASRRGDKLKK